MTEKRGLKVCLGSGLGTLSTEWGCLQNSWKICLLLFIALFLVVYCLPFSFFLEQTNAIQDTVNKMFNVPLLSHLGRRNENWPILSISGFVSDLLRVGIWMAERLQVTVLHGWWDTACRGYCREALWKGPDFTLPLPEAAGAHCQLCSSADEAARWSEGRGTLPTRKGWDSWHYSAWERKGSRLTFQHLNSAYTKDGEGFL